ncbi:MAG: tRNA (adenosine(37)-N6)-threonylcarbamoyltransferase complex ATPase subunit type 1 TsaE, partial [Anaerolineales bacterium]
TFVLVNLYRRLDGSQFHHLDAYRLKDAREAEELDLETYVGTGPLVVEWAERIKAALPADHLWVSLRLVDVDQRDFIFTARGSYYESLLDSFRMRIYGGL